MILGRLRSPGAASRRVAAELPTPRIVKVQLDYLGSAGLGELKTLELGILENSLDGRTREDAKSAAENDLVERAKADPRVFGQLFDLHYERILGYAYRCTLNRTVAEELTSNTFFRALRGLPKYRRRAPFYVWLYRIATNEIRMHRRSERRKRTTASDPIRLQEKECIFFETTELEAEEDHREKMRCYARLHELLDQLPERYRNVIVLRFFEDLQYEAIARVLGKRMGTVKSLIHRALRRLRIILEEDATFCATRHCSK